MANQPAELQTIEPTISQRFTDMVVKEFGSQVGTLELSLYQQKLAKHLFIGIDKALNDLEAKRLRDGKTKQIPIVWSNVNMQKLAIDAVHRIELGLDALIPNHIHTVPYFNSKLKKYDLDLSVGYVGKDYYKRKMALDPPKDIIYQLVHESDTFTVHMKKAHNDIESYDFEIANPFNRGPVVGGFGYIMFDDPTKNKLIVVPKTSMDKSKNAAKTKTFWEAHEENMMMVVVVRRVTAALNIDPEKVNVSFAAVELDENQSEINANANQEFVDIEPTPGQPVDAEFEAEAQPADVETQPEIDQEAEPVYLTCPESINKKRPRKSIDVCKECTHKTQCNPYIEWAMDNEPTPETEGPGF